MTRIALYALTSLAFWENSKYILSALVLSQKASLEVQCCLVHEKQTNKQRLSCVKMEKDRGKSLDSKNSWLPPFQKNWGRDCFPPSHWRRHLGGGSHDDLPFPSLCLFPQGHPSPIPHMREKDFLRGLSMVMSVPRGKPFNHSSSFFSLKRNPL